MTGLAALTEGSEHDPLLVAHRFSRRPHPRVRFVGGLDAHLMTIRVAEREPRSDSIAALAQVWDYRDRFTVETAAGQYVSVDQVVTDWFTKQPGWIRIISTSVLSRGAVMRAIGRGDFPVGSAVGSWRVVHRSEREIVFGDRLGFMEYWYSFLLPLDDTNTIEGSTAVRYLWPRSGRFYFALVRPFHRRFIERALSTTVSQRADRSGPRR